MSKRKGQSASHRVKNQLRELAQTSAVDFNRLVIQYATERLLYRIGISSYREEFVLKGALLLSAWGGPLRRPTRDADFLGLCSTDIDVLVEMFREIAKQVIVDDGLDFPSDQIHGTRIREDTTYEGVRITLGALLGTTSVTVQLDIGFGDVVVPSPRDLELPALLDFPAPNLRTYSPESVIAEKVHALVVLGMINSRMKDFYDIAQLAEYARLDYRLLSDAMIETFRRRRSDIPQEIPVALTEMFWNDEQKLKQWNAFVRRNALLDASTTLRETIERITALLVPILRDIAARGI